MFFCNLRVYSSRRDIALFFNTANILYQMGTSLENFSSQILDASPVATVLFDEQLHPTFISIEALQLLGLARDAEIPDETLLPLREIAERACRSAANPRPFSKHAPMTNRIVVSLRGGHSAEILVSASPLHSENGVCCVMTLWDLSAVAPLSAALSLFRNARFVAVSAISQMAAASNELLSILNSALSAVDALLLPTVGVVIESDTSALVKIAPQKLFTALCHLIIETSDFAAPDGKVHLRCVLKPQEQRLSRGKTQGGNISSTMELVLLAQQEETRHAPNGPLERFLLGLLRTHPYRVTTADEEPTLKQLASGEPTLAKFRLKDKTLPDNASIAPEAYSPHLKAAAEALHNEPAELQVRRLRRNALVAYLGLEIL